MTTLYAYQGKDFEENAVFLNNNGTAFNVTNHTSYLKVAKYYNADPTETITINGTIVPPATNGTFNYVLLKNSLLNLKSGNHVYTRYLLDSTGKVVTVDSGDFVVIPAVL
jgi:hypothetical protein